MKVRNDFPLELSQRIFILELRLKTEFGLKKKVKVFNTNKTHQKSSETQISFGISRQQYKRLGISCL